MIKHIVFIILLVVSAQCFSEARINFGLARGNIDLSVGAFPRDLPDGGETYGFTLYGGYLSDNNLIFDAGVSVLSDEALFGALGNVELVTMELLLGYSHRWDSMYFEPKVGMAKWSLSLSSGYFFSPNGNRVEEDMYGYSPVVFLTLGKEFSSIFGMSLSYKYMSDNDFDASSLILGFDWQF